MQLSILACRMIEWSEHHWVKDQRYAPDGRPVPHELALASRKEQLASIKHTVTRRSGGAQVINAYDSKKGAGWRNLGKEALQGSFQRLHKVTKLSTSVFLFVDDPWLQLEAALSLLRTGIERLQATAARHWLAIQTGPHRISTDDIADLLTAAHMSHWQLTAAWSTAPPGQCRAPMEEPGNADGAVQGVALYPYLLLELICTSAAPKAPISQSSGARHVPSTSGSVVSLCKHCHTVCSCPQAAVTAVMVHTLARRRATIMMHHPMVPAGAHRRKATHDFCQGHQAQGSEYRLLSAGCQCDSL